MVQYFSGLQFWTMLSLTTMVDLGIEGLFDESVSNIFNGNFEAFHNVAIHSDTSSCSVKQTRYGRLKCVDLCVGDVWCVAVYAEFSTDTNKDLWNCYLCITAWDVSLLGPGNGHYAIAQYPSRGMTGPAPSFPGVINEGVGMINGHMAAIGRCPHHPGNYIYFAFDIATRTWPQYSTSCGNTICNIESVRNIVVSVVPVPNYDGKYHFYPKCAADEEPRGFATCQGGGVWTQYDYLWQMCIPTKCVKWNSINIPAYHGTANTTKTGRDCQRWDSPVINHHFYNIKPLSNLFILDDMNATLAENYCRSVKEIYLWCFTTDPLMRWDMCLLENC